MLSESARMTTAHEASFRIQYPNSKQRAVKIIALDRPSAKVVDEISKQQWHGAAFFKSVSFGADGAPGDSQGTTLKAWLDDLAGRTMELVSEIATADFVVVLASAGADARAVSVVADACALHSKTLVALVMPQNGADDEDVSKSLSYLRPYAKMLVVAHDADYVTAMLSALRA